MVPGFLSKCLSSVVWTVCTMWKCSRDPTYSLEYRLRLPNILTFLYISPCTSSPLIPLLPRAYQAVSMSRLLNAPVGPIDLSTTKESKGILQLDLKRACSTVSALPHTSTLLESFSSARSPNDSISKFFDAHWLILTDLIPLLSR